MALTAAYANYDMGNIQKDETEFNIKYKINKKLSAKASYTTFGKDEVKSDYEVRTYLSYKF